MLVNALASSSFFMHLWPFWHEQNMFAYPWRKKKVFLFWNLLRPWKFSWIMHLSCKLLFHYLRLLTSQIWISYVVLISVQTGSGSSARKRSLIVNLMRSCREKEMKFLVRTLVHPLTWLFCLIFYYFYMGMTDDNVVSTEERWLVTLPTELFAFLQANLLYFILEGWTATSAARWSGAESTDI